MTSDIIFLQKREFPRDFEKETVPDWVNVTANLAGIEMNSYFMENPQMVLGEMKEVSGRFGTKVICSPYENRDLSELLDEAVSNIKRIEPDNIIDEEIVENAVITKEDVTDEITPDNKNVPESSDINDNISSKSDVKTNEKSDMPSGFEDEVFINEVDPEGHRNFCYDIIDGNIYFRENDIMKKQNLKGFHTKDAFDRMSGMIEISKCLQELIKFQLENYSNEDIAKQQKKLNTLYDNFTAKCGLLSSRSNRNIFKDDDTAPLLQSLENLNEKGGLESKADIFTKRTIIPYTQVKSVDTASEALAVSISEKAKVDLDFMSELCSKPKEEIVNELEGVIFENPFTGKYETADEYLSGNVRKKLADTEKYTEVFKERAEKYKSNIEALKKVQPADLLPSEIFVQLGSTWIPTKYYEEFMYDLLKTPDRCKSDNISFWSKDPFVSSGRNCNRSIIAIDYNEHSATYAISNKGSSLADSSNVLSNKTYGTNRRNAYQILEDTLNMKPVKIFDYYEDSDGKKKAVLNQKETILAQNKQNLIKSKFKEWIFDDAERTKVLCRIYNDKFNCENPRQYNGEHINFVGMNPEITLREHQRNAIAHTLYGGNTLLAHVVGSGKTYEMVASAMESKRLGLCHKSLIAVPKAIVNQFAKEFLQLYPAANILVPGENDFSEKNRRRFCSRIATGNYDAIIISHNQLEKIPLSKQRQIEYIENQINEIIVNLEVLKAQKGERGFTVKELEATKKNLQNKLKDLNNDDRRDTTVTFEELGVDKLYIDEAHLHKNLFFTSKMGRNVSGINTSSNSQRATDLQMKCQYLDEKTGSKGVVFATGTPVSNSIAELFTMQRYLQNTKLKELHIDSFDSWASTYAETKMAMELAPEGKGYQMKTRFAKFSNLPELMNMFKEVADVKTADVLNLPVPKAHYHTISAEASQHQKNMVDELAKRADKIRKGLVEPTEDNMLAVTNDGRKLALDQRLMNPLLPDEPNSKINLCVENVFKIWQDEAENKSTQIIFSDLSTPNTTGFNIYDDIKKKLIDKGIPKEQIAFIHDCKTDVQKQNLFTKVNNGEVRVLLGSTNKLGTGVNCQKRLKAVHHCDCPWKPAELEQRNGRIIRQGNLNKEVDVYNYITKSTFDSYLYQVVENKQRFISQIMTSKSPARSAEDVDESVLNYAQIKAIAAGDPRIQEKMNLDIEVAKLHTLFGDWQKEKRDMQTFLLTTYPAKLKEYTEIINAIDTDITFAEETKNKEFTGMTVSGKLYSDKKEAGQALLTLMSIVIDNDERAVGEYRGFKASVKYNPLNHEFIMTLKNNFTFSFPLSNDIYGNITRMDNAINSLDSKRIAYTEKLDLLEKNAANTKAEIEKPFSRLDELHEKEQRLERLNVELAMKNNDTDTPEKNDNETKDKEIAPIKTSISVKEKKADYAYR